MRSRRVMQEENMSKRRLHEESNRAQYMEHMTSSLRGVSGLMPQGSFRTLSQNEPAFITSLAGSMRGRSGSLKDVTRKNNFYDPGKPEMKEMEVQTSFKFEAPNQKGKTARQMFRPRPKGAEKI